MPAPRVAVTGLQRMRGRIRPAVLAVVGVLAGSAVAAVGWLSLAEDSLAEVQERLQERDRYAQFVDEPAPGFTLTDGGGASISLSDFRGKVVVLNFVYARCREICPPHMAILSDLQDRIDRIGLADRVEFITLATDTEASDETAGIIAGYGADFGLEPGNWRMLHRGDRQPRTVIDLAAEYGLEFRVVMAAAAEHEPSNAAVERQVHGAVTHVIGPTGRLRARFHGLRFGRDTFTDYVQALVERGLAQ